MRKLKKIFFAFIKFDNNLNFFDTLIFLSRFEKFIKFIIK